ncbi:hypothetical protein SAMN05216223_112128 [Actinacidiphila yanglinensis]|uniref:Uncharacterized protein n=1 Tax=Actinacidiphila yanglinensis TaxID=310779 RepID=A0A1H6D7U5_9ACTN|nr:hypothetical protein [Actinacidiphila yanglinensis]SEG80933.1 hypothetical protein SAMN05216223_112128 [Actinacidiphila yanglinensis]
MSSPHLLTPEEKLADAKKLLSLPRIVVICGPTRFMTEMNEADLRETTAGRIVVKPGCDLKSPHELWSDPGEAEALKVRLDALHRAKIRLADDVLVVNVRPSSPAHGARGHLPSGPALCIDGSLSPLRVKSEGTSEFVSLLLAA